jgi:hypothetical protein
MQSHSDIRVTFPFILLVVSYLLTWVWGTLKQLAAQDWLTILKGLKCRKRKRFFWLQLSHACPIADIEILHVDEAKISKCRVCPPNGRPWNAGGQDCDTLFEFQLLTYVPSKKTWYNLVRRVVKRQGKIAMSFSNGSSFLLKLRA